MNKIDHTEYISKPECISRMGKQRAKSAKFPSSVIRSLNYWRGHCLVYHAQSFSSASTMYKPSLNSTIRTCVLNLCSIINVLNAYQAKLSTLNK